ncbi:Na+/solute symporter [Rubrobacter xylanophilus DSM 9941]|uniref:Na+/solute symporter n=1 Tax=Rubrobacter xylanophilus (strain DSM 9941 / JCM 11954 / NBRC 16129 / PRD-1) TaxID=266117 RepID=Q1AS12_RUBXD|nr:sodium:solute symporter [Rubrobacter xylanophilus]ABG05816.1 Na+/solute symporter [Rubrobacter xylanophilus DSM 9941]
MVSALDYLVIGLYFAAMIAAGYWGLRRARSADDYLVAGRRLGPLLYIGTLGAVVLGGASTIGTVALGYENGVSGMWLVFMIGLGIIALGLLLSTRLSRLGVYTVSEMLGLRYGPSARLISAIIVASYALMIAVTSTIAIGTVFDVVLGLPPAVAILVAGGVVVAYSVAGGMWSITLTDFLQFCVMTAGIFLALLPLAVARAGGLSGMRAELPASYFDLASIGWGTIFTYFLLFFFGLMIGQDIWQRVFTARSAPVARWGGLVAGLYCLLYGLAGALIGTAARALVPDLQVADNAFARVATEVLPAGLLGLVLAAALAAVMSTASAGLLASSTILANDVYAGIIAREGRSDLGESRVFTLIVGVAVLAISLAVQDVVGALTIAYNLLTGALFVPIIGALFWRRATGAGALVSMLVSSAVVVALMLWQGLLANSPIYVGMLTSLVVFVGVSLLTRPQTAGDAPRL